MMRLMLEIVMLCSLLGGLFFVTHVLAKEKRERNNNTNTNTNTNNPDQHTS